MRRAIVKVLGAVACGVGLVWILQGIGILPGSFMTGQVEWAVIGGATLSVGLLMLAAGLTRRGRRGRATSGAAGPATFVSGDGGGCSDGGGGGAC